MQVLHEDNHLLVVVKPPGVLSQGDRTGDESILDRARRWIAARHAKPGRAFVALVHRLDRPVGGVMVLARTSKAASRLAAQFRTGQIDKRYRAVVDGRPRPAESRLVHHLLRRHTPERGTEVSVVESGATQARRCELHYTTLETRGDRALLEIDLFTGRSHQIRAQLSAAGHPILGDTKYGSRVALPGRAIALYACRLELTHPTTKQRMLFEAAPPEGWPWD